MDRSGLVAGFIALLTALPLPASAGAPQGTGFTYQGQLKQDGVLANGPTDFVFRLFDAAAGGDQIGPDVVRGSAWPMALSPSIRTSAPPPSTEKLALTY